MSVGSYTVVSRAELLLFLCFPSMIDVAYETIVRELEWKERRTSEEKFT